jgi:hypothetical protein
MYVGGNRSPPEETYAVNESRSLYHMRNEFDRGIEPTSSEVTGTDVNFEHRSYHCATRTAVQRAYQEEMS